MKRALLNFIEACITGIVFFFIISVLLIMVIGIVIALGWKILFGIAFLPVFYIFGKFFEILLKE